MQGHIASASAGYGRSAQATWCVPCCCGVLAVRLHSVGPSGYCVLAAHFSCHACGATGVPACWLTLGAATAMSICMAWTFSLFVASYADNLMGSAHQYDMRSGCRSQIEGSASCLFCCSSQGAAWNCMDSTSMLELDRWHGRIMLQELLSSNDCSPCPASGMALVDLLVGAAHRKAAAFQP